VIVYVIMAAMVNQVLANLSIGADADPAVDVQRDPLTSRMQSFVVVVAQQDQVVKRGDSTERPVLSVVSVAPLTRHGAPGIATRAVADQQRIAHRETDHPGGPAHIHRLAVRATTPAIKG